MNHTPCFIATSLNPQTVSSSISLNELPETTQQHLKSLRIKANETVNFLNGQGVVFKTQSNLNNKTLSFNVLEIKSQKKLEPKINLYFSPPIGSALEETLIQACEIGVNNFYFLRSQHNQYNRQHLFKSERLKRIIESACTQCTQPWLPELHTEWITLDEAMSHAQKSTIVIAQESLAGIIKTGQTRENSKLSNKYEFSLFIGPEGGWSLEEESLLERKSQISLCLGDLILRVPTAVVASCFWIRSHFEG
ncbi:MAG: RsmE family RNA methyltransferase [Proteobacteria bacterium]|nr:RsmE family RNA methyltransferase [Pseudomonadota bacterium]